MEDSNYVFSFVILHYLTIDDTCLCVESIEKYCSNYNYHIVIVDNGSKNGTGERLVEKYKDSKRIKVIVSEKNLGFANGNNIGFEYSKKHLNADFIILANNDTLLLNSDFCHNVIDEYEKSSFAVMGPKIVLRDGKINPIAYPNLDINVVERQLKRYKASLFCDKHILIYSLKKIYQDVKGILRKKNNVENKVVDDKFNVNIRHENLLLHGCFFVFSRKYIDLFDGLNNKTFLYREEELLYKRIKDNNLLNVYNPSVVIKHNEDSATNAMNKSSRKKSIFVNENRIKSTEVLLNELKGVNNGR